ncbi:MAG: RidA family protein [Bacillota bacterium]|jgi:2-iminobutanoate/2-iminopropanoate deaminase
MKEIKTDKAPQALGPYSQGIVMGNMLFTSGQVGINPENGEIDADIAEQAKQVLKNVKAVVEAGGGSMNDVVKTTVFIKNMDDFAKVNEIYAEFFTEPFPARSCVEVARLPKDLLVEMEAVVELK